MTVLDSDKVLKRVWLLNGLLILLIIIGAGVVMIVGVITALSSYDDRVSSTVADDSATPRAVRLYQPENISGTETQLIQVYHGNGYYNLKDDVAKFSSSMLADVYIPDDPMVNVIFMRVNGKGHLLFDKPVLIENIDYPTDESDKQPRRNWITYQVITTDTSGNKNLDAGDRVDLYISDIEGLGLKRLLDDNYTVESARAVGSGAYVLIYAYKQVEDQRISEDDLRQWVFIYDPVTKKLTTDVLNDLSSKAASILAK